VVLPDLIGFGDSTRSDDIEELWTEAQADALEALLDELRVENFSLAVHDYGGPVGLALLQRDQSRVSRLVIGASNLFADTPIPFPLSGIFLPVVGGVWSRLLFSKPALGAMVRFGSRGKANSRKALGDGEQARAIATIFGSALRELEARYAPVQQFLSEITVPTEVLWGTKDPFFSAEQGKRTAREIPGASLTLLEGAGHFLPEERPEAYVAAIEGACNGRQRKV
jgi:pimeloyl-ACP methyl ester carboxylesterase